MFIDITRLQNRSTNEFLYKNTIVLDEALYKNTDIRKLSPVEVSADIKRITDTSYKMSLEIKGEMTLPCSITLNDVIYPFDIKTEVKLSNEDEEDEEFDDSELECIVLNIFKGGDREYIALLPTEGIEAEEGTVYLYRYEEDEQGNPNLTNIESDEEYEIASDAFDEMLDDEEYDELVSEEELAAEEEDAKKF
mgnify:CR=1 FL=1